MTDDILAAVVIALNQYLTKKMGEEHPDPSPYVILENISRLSQQQQNNAHSIMNDRVVVTLINIEEDRVLHNSYASQSAAGVKPQPKQKLSLYCLFSIPVEPYSRALQFLSIVMDFFYHHPRIALAPFLGSLEKTDTYPKNIEIELVSLNMEQLSELWGTLGCKHLPSVFYKIRI
jgi:hypothetical protein